METITPTHVCIADTEISMLVNTGDNIDIQKRILKSGEYIESYIDCYDLDCEHDLRLSVFVNNSRGNCDVWYIPSWENFRLLPDVEISRIVLDNGNTFDGTPAQFADTFFSNVTEESVRVFCEEIGSSLLFEHKINS